jgi:RNA polymerase sigma factor (sigma-70 family)
MSLRHVPRALVPLTDHERPDPLPTDRAVAVRVATAAVGPAEPLDATAIAARALRVARRTALGILGDRAAADDVAQDVAIAAVRSAGQLREPAALDGWLHRSAVHAAIREAKRGRRRREVELAAHHAAGPGEGEEDERVDRLLALLAGLPPRQRAALTLRYVHDLDDDAIARALRCRAVTVRSLLSRGRDALRAALDAEPEDHR